MRTSPFAFLRRTSFLLLALFATGCDTSNTETDPRPRCPPDAGVNCGVAVSGGGGPTGGGGSGGDGSGGSSATNDIEGNLGVFNDTTFTFVSPYLGESTIFTTSAAGGLIDAPYGPNAKTFLLTDVMNGPTWFFVRDETIGATGVFSTHSVVSVPVAGLVTLPVVDENIIQSIAGTLPSPIVVDTSKAVVVLKFLRNGQPLSGVSLSNALPGAELAYDTGIGLYSNQVLQTGPAGMLLAINVDGPSAAELRELTVVDANQQAYFIQIRLQAGTATMAGFTL